MNEQAQNNEQVESLANLLHDIQHYGSILIVIVCVAALAGLALTMFASSSATKTARPTGYAFNTASSARR